MIPTSEDIQALTKELRRTVSESVLLRDTVKELAQAVNRLLESKRVDVEAMLALDAARRATQTLCDVKDDELHRRGRSHG